MARLTTAQWLEARTLFESAERPSLEDIGRKIGVSHVAILKRSRKEQWQRAGEQVRINQSAIAKADAKVTSDATSKVTDVTAKSRIASREQSEDLRAEVLVRHRQEWGGARERIYAGLKAHREATDRDSKALAFDDLKAAKISAEAMTLVQNGERKAYGMEDAASAPTQSVIVVDLVAVAART